MATITFDKPNKYIEIDISDTSVTIQELINAIRNFEDEQLTMDLASLANASGKQALGGGISVGITLELLDNWRVHFADRPGPATITCSITGGNLVTISDFSNNPIAPSTFVTVTITASSSATLQELSSIQFSSYNGGVTIDNTTSNTGVEFPVGTLESPVNNIADAQSIAAMRGFNKLFIIDDIVMSSSYSLSGYTVIGQSPSTSIIEFESGCQTTGSIFEDMTVTGSFSGLSSWNRVHFGNTSGLQGSIHDSLFESTASIIESGSIDIIDCWSGIAGSGTPHVQANGYFTMLIRNWSGDIHIDGVTGGESSIDILSGNIVLAENNTGGSIIVRGVSKFTDNTTGTTVDSSGLLDRNVVADRVWFHDSASFVKKATALIPATV